MVNEKKNEVFSSIATQNDVKIAMINFEGVF